MKILELDTGLFPDRDTVASAVGTLEGAHSVERQKVAGLSPDDKEGWAAVATALVAADLIVTL